MPSGIDFAKLRKEREQRQLEKKRSGGAPQSARVGAPARDGAAPATKPPESRQVHVPAPAATATQVTPPPAVSPPARCDGAAPATKVPETCAVNVPAPAATATQVTPPPAVSPPPTPPNLDLAAPATREPPEARACGACTFHNEAGATKCEMCESPLGPPTSPVPGAGSGPTGGARTLLCGACTFHNEAGTALCAMCGTPLGAHTPGGGGVSAPPTRPVPGAGMRSGPRGGGRARADLLTPDVVAKQNFRQPRFRAIEDAHRAIAADARALRARLDAVALRELRHWRAALAAMPSGAVSFALACLRVPPSPTGRARARAPRAANCNLETTC